MHSIPEHRVIQPSALYFGTPIALITTTQPDGSINISPMSSAWALGERLVLGLGTEGQCLRNLLRAREAVVNLPSEALAIHVERIARTTGRNPVPAAKQANGYFFEADKFRRARLTPLASERVAPPRIAECPIQLETVLLAEHPASRTAESPDPGYSMVELAVVRVHAHAGVTVADTNRIDVSRWRPLFFVFRHYFGLGSELGRNFRAEI